MKFSQLRAFQKHLDEASPNHLASLYFIVDPDLYAQRKWASLIQSNQARSEFFYAPDLTQGKLTELFEMQNLFEPFRQCILLEIDKAPKAHLDFILGWLKNPLGSLRLILTASQMTSFGQKILKEAVALDLSKEKPWDKEKRLADYVTLAFKKANLHISSALALEFSKQSAFQLAFMDQDLEKLICFLKDKKEVKREDFSLLRKKSTASIFKIGEALLDKRLKEALLLIHQEDFHVIPLIYSLRTLFQRTLRLNELSSTQATLAYPKFKGKWLEKMQIQAKSYPKEILQKVLTLLFDLEVQLKNQSLDEKMAKSLCLLKLGELL